MGRKVIFKLVRLNNQTHYTSNYHKNLIIATLVEYISLNATRANMPT